MPTIITVSENEDDLVDQTAGNAVGSLDCLYYSGNDDGSLRAGCVSNSEVHTGGPTGYVSHGEVYTVDSSDDEGSIDDII